MKNLLLLLLPIFLSVGIFSSCKDKTDPAPKVITKEDHLKGNTWKLISVETVPAIDGIDPMDFLEDCYTDNLYNFLDGGVLVVDEGPLVCNEDDLQQLNGQWDISDDEKQLNLKYADIDQDFEIVELDDTQLKVKTDIVFQSISLVGNLTFKPEE